MTSAFVVSATLVLLAAVFVGQSSAAAAAWPANGDFRDDRDEYNELEIPEAIQRRADGWCARWGDTCNPESRMKLMTCCSGLTCSCPSGIFQSSSKCQCKREGLLGRRRR